MERYAGGTCERLLRLPGGTQRCLGMPREHDLVGNADEVQLKRLNPEDRERPEDSHELKWTSILSSLDWCGCWTRMNRGRAGRACFPNRALSRRMVRRWKPRGVLAAPKAKPRWSGDIHILASCRSMPPRPRRRRLDCSSFQYRRAISSFLRPIARTRPVIICNNKQCERVWILRSNFSKTNSGLHFRELQKCSTAARSWQ